MRRLEVSSRREAFHSRTGCAPVSVQVEEDLWIGGVHNGDVCFVASSDASRVVKLSEATSADIDDVVAVAASASSVVVATSSLLVRHWDVEAWSPLQVRLAATTKAHRGPVRCVDLERTGALVATGSADRTVRVLDTRQSLACTHVWTHEGVVLAVKFHPRELRLAAACETFEVTIWDLTTKKALARLAHAARVASLAWMRHWLVTGSHDETIRVWSEDGALQSETSAEEQVEAVVAIDKRRFATGGSDGVVRVWTVDDAGRCALTSAEELSRGDLAPCLHLSCAGGCVIVATAESLRVLDDAMTLSTELLSGDDDIVACGLVDSDRALVATGTSEIARVVDMATWRVVRRLEGHDGTVLAVDVAYGYLATASKDRTSRVWDGASFECVCVCVGHLDPVGAIAIGKTQDDVWLATAARDRALKKWRVPAAARSPLEEAEAVRSALAHDKDVNSIAVAPTGLLVATASQDRTVKLWNDRLELQQTLTGHKRGVWQVVFSTYKKTVASCSSDKTVKLWSVASGACLATLDGHEASVLSLALQGDTLVSAAADGVMKLWEGQTCHCTLDAHDDKIWAVALTDAGALTVGAGGRLCRWTDATEKDEEEKRRQRADVERKEQILRDALRDKDYAAALDEAFELDRPHTAWQVTTALLTSSHGRSDLSRLISTWPLARAKRYLDFVREWNTDARKAPVAQRVLKALVDRFPLDALLAKDAAMRAAIAAYTRRHLQRLDRLAQSTFVLDSTLSALDRHKQQDIVQPPLRKKRKNKMRKGSANRKRIKVAPR